MDAVAWITTDDNRFDSQQKSQHQVRILSDRTRDLQ